MNLTEYIKNKTVIFVGSCPNMLGRGLGKFIDSYDIVARANGSINLIEDENFQKDFGSRCNLLYINNQFHRHNKPLPVADYVAKGVKMIALKHCPTRYRIDYCNQISTRVISDVIRLIVPKLPSCTMGNFAWTDILQARPRELFLTGVDFFASRNIKDNGNDIYHEYIDGYLQDSIRKEAKVLNSKKSRDSHDFLENAKYTKSLKDTYNNFKMSDFVEQTLNEIICGKLKQRIAS
jgi:hypothetical protein